jgi:hypothetical protein
MFQFPQFPFRTLFIHVRIRQVLLTWVSPFGYPRIKACLRLPVAFRSLPRPSSAPGAKAFSLCSFFLDLTFLALLLLYHAVFKEQLVVGSSGLEPPTSRLSGVRSNHLSYEPVTPERTSFSQNQTAENPPPKPVGVKLSVAP